MAVNEFRIKLHLTKVSLIQSINMGVSIMLMKFLRCTNIKALWNRLLILYQKIVFMFSLYKPYSMYTNDKKYSEETRQS